jgi:2-oxoglutarate ferredoxin oxidoreductase subunit delta
MAWIEIDKARCKSCQLCLDACPKKIIKLAPTLNNFGYREAYLASPEECTGCGRCYLICPDVAIEVYK